MNIIVATNNSLAADAMSNKIADLIYTDSCSFLDVLIMSKNLIVSGHMLMINPLIGNIPPYEMPYKTVIMTENGGAVDFNSLKIIDNAITLTRRAMNEMPKAFWQRDDLECLKRNDLAVVERWLLKLYLPELRGMIKNTSKEER